ncbi:MAG: hypothetical protein JWP37_1483 [Mucilaginibacter sp.]|nr:hypothetical protein [Mucilaginibacter sp.]
MASIETEVNKIISDIVNMVLPDYNTTLSTLGFNDAMCTKLAGRLDSFVNEKHPTATVNNNEITADLTIRNVMDLVTKKIES